MDGLLPIIRRQRRPLVVADAPPPVVVGNVAPVPAVAIKPAETVLTGEQPQASDAKVSSKRSAR